MAAAVPTSAWQPPAAPDRVACAAKHAPIAPATSSPSISVSSFKSWSRASVRKIPGSTPDAPAVGAATMRPIAALSSTVAIEDASM